MATKETVTPNPVEEVRSAMKHVLENRYWGKVVGDWIHEEVAHMVDYRFLKKDGQTVPENPDEMKDRQLVRAQKACIIADGGYFDALGIWEDHNDIAKRNKLFILDYSVDGEIFLWAGIPTAPIIFCDINSIPKSDLQKLANKFVLIDDVDYKVY